MDFTSGFSFVLDVVPLINAAVDREGRHLDSSAADSIVLADIFILDYKLDIVSNVLDVYNPEFVFPLRSLTGALKDFGLVSLLSVFKDDIGIHLADEFGVASKSRFNDLDSHFTVYGSVHLLYQLF